MILEQDQAWVTLSSCTDCGILHICGLLFLRIAHLLFVGFYTCRPSDIWLSWQKAWPLGHCYEQTVLGEQASRVESRPEPVTVTWPGEWRTYLDFIMRPGCLRGMETALRALLCLLIGTFVSCPSNIRENNRHDKMLSSLSHQGRANLKHKALSLHIRPSG